MARGLLVLADVMFEKIVCATDFSSGADHALEMAITIALDQGADLVIVHAWDVPAFTPEVGLAPDLIEATVEADDQLLVAAVRRATDRGVHASGRRLRGLAAQAVIELAKCDPTIDLIVVGTHGRSGLRRVLLGSVAEKIVRLSPISVLVVHPEDTLRPMQRGAAGLHVR